MRFNCVLISLAAFLPLIASDQRPGPKFRPDDPLMADNDRAIDVGELPDRDESDIYDFVEHTFLDPGSGANIPALNVNTIDEVPDSSWFTNRYADGLPAAAALARGPDTLPALDIAGWPVSEGKGEGATPGFRVRGPDGEDYQLKFDPISNPEMATAAEMIGTAFYHAFGYNVVEMYLVEFDPSYTILPDATISFQGGSRRPLAREDVEAVLGVSARLPNGRYRAVARKMPRGDSIGGFRYYGTRSDDPNDIFPHEHRRELRGARVFAAWLDHDDSKGLNSKDIVVREGGRRHVKHFMYDFNSTLGAGTHARQGPRNGNAYMFDAGAALKALLTFGLHVPAWARIEYVDDLPPAVGRFESDGFDPVAWRPNYPIPAFELMRPEDAFWAARIVARFDEPAVRAIVGKGRYSDPAAAGYIVKTLMERREKILRVWLNAVMPLVDPVLDDSGFSFRNAAIDAGAAPRAVAYDVAWHAFDNATGQHRLVGDIVRIGPGDRVPLPAALQTSEFVMVTVSADGAHPTWRTPARVYFRRQGGGWKLVGLERHRR